MTTMNVHGIAWLLLYISKPLSSLVHNPPKPFNYFVNAHIYVNMLKFSLAFHSCYNVPHVGIWVTIHWEYDTDRTSMGVFPNGSSP